MKRTKSHHPRKHLIEKKSTPPGIINSPLVQGLLNLIPLVVVINLFVLNYFFQEPSRFKALALQQNQPRRDELMQLAVLAAQESDFTLAQQLYAKVDTDQLVLGAKTEAEEIIFPELKLERELGTTLAQAKVHPSRTLYLNLAILEWRLNHNTNARGYLNLARAIDPNDPDLEWVEKTLGD